jgi:uncharacterized membrane protein YdbT with pleckstrin-like domain
MLGSQFRHQTSISKTPQHGGNPLSYVESNLIPGEQVLYKTGLHWIVLFWPVLFAAFFGLGALPLLIVSIATIGDKNGPAGGVTAFVLLLMAGLLVFLGYLKRAATEMAVTNKRVIIKTGLLSRRTFELLMSKIESIGVDEGMLGRMLGYGSLVVRGTGGTPEPFKNISHPLEFRRQVQQQIEKHEQQRLPPPVAPSVLV